jgi:hypothetical protein
MGQLERRLASGKGFGAFWGGGERKGGFGIMSEGGESRTVSGNREWCTTVPLCTVLTSVAKLSAFAPALSSTRKGIFFDEQPGDHVGRRTFRNGSG